MMRTVKRPKRKPHAALDCPCSECARWSWQTIRELQERVATLEEALREVNRG